MADTTKKVSELETASQVDSTDLVMLSQGSSQSGFASLKTTILALAQKIVSGINFTSALETESKTITGAINEVAQGGGGASELDDLDDVEITNPTEGQALVYDATNEVWTNGAGGGHTILNDSGTSLAQEDDLQFKGTYSHDDSTNGKTVVEITREMTQAEYDLLSADEKKGIIRITDDNYVCDGTEVKYSTGVSVKDKIDNVDGRIFATTSSETTYSIPFEKFKVYRDYGVALVSAWKDLFLIFFIGNNTVAITKLGGFDNSHTATISWNESTQAIEITFSYTVWGGITILPM